jgi:hypothetical protein
MISPAMILKDGRPAVLLGTMGGDGQIQTMARLATALLDFGLEAREPRRWGTPTSSAFDPRLLNGCAGSMAGFDPSGPFSYLIV